jgi:glycosyltransferase involved in cell wall biosynthesis
MKHSSTLIVIHHFAKLGGGELAIRDYVLEVFHSDQNIKFICLQEGPLVEQLRAYGVETYVYPISKVYLDMPHKLSFRKVVNLLWTVPFLAMEWFHLYRFLRVFKGGVLISNSPKSLIISRPCSKLAGLKEVHVLHENIQRSYGPRILNRFTRALMNSCDGIFCVSNSARASYVKWGGTATKALVVWQGISFPPDLGIDYARSTMVLGTASRINQVKNIEQIIDAAAILHKTGMKVRLEIAGEPTTEEDRIYKQSLQKKIEHYNLRDYVVFKGFCPDIWSLLLGLDVYVTTSRSEGLGRSLIEAMGVGLPCIVTPVGGLAESVSDGETGLYVALDRPAELAEKIKSLILSVAERNRLGRAAAQSARLRHCSGGFLGAIQQFSRINDPKSSVGKC